MPWRRSAVGTILISIVMGVLGIAGVMKLVDLSAFYAVLITWSLIPHSIAPVLSLLVPSMEILIAGVWFARSHRSLACVSAMVLLTCFTVAVGAHLLVSSPPRCGCFGAHVLFQEQRDEAIFVLGRNAVLLVFLGIGLGFGHDVVR